MEIRTTLTASIKPIYYALMRESSVLWVVQACTDEVWLWSLLPVVRVAALNLLLLTCLCVYCSRCLRTDGVWVAYWYKPIFLNHESDSNRGMFKFFFQNEFQAAAVSAFGQTDTAGPARGLLGCHIIVREGRGGELGGRELPPWPLHGQATDPKRPEPAILFPLPDAMIFS